jgi:hypothetical protein
MASIGCMPNSNYKKPSAPIIKSLRYEHGMDKKEMKGKRNLHKMICRSESADCCNQLLKNSSIFAWLFKKELKYVRQTITNHLHYFDNYVMIIECFMYNSNELIEYFSQVSIEIIIFLFENVNFKKFFLPNSEILLGLRNYPQTFVFRQKGCCRC